MRRLFTFLMVISIGVTLVHTGLAIAHEALEAPHAGGPESGDHDHSAPAPGSEHDSHGPAMHGHDAAGHLQALTPVPFLLLAKLQHEDRRPGLARWQRQPQSGGIDRPPRAG